MSLGFGFPYGIGLPVNTEYFSHNCSSVSIFSGSSGIQSTGQDLLALRVVEMPDAFCAFVWINNVDLFALVDGFIGAFWFAYVTVDAFLQ